MNIRYIFITYALNACAVQTQEPSSTSNSSASYSSQSSSLEAHVPTETIDEAFERLALPLYQYYGIGEDSIEEEGYEFGTDDVVFTRQKPLIGMMVAVGSYTRFAEGLGNYHIPLSLREPLRENGCKVLRESSFATLKNEGLNIALDTQHPFYCRQNQRPDASVIDLVDIRLPYAGPNSLLAETIVLSTEYYAIAQIYTLTEEVNNEIDTFFGPAFFERHPDATEAPRWLNESFSLAHDDVLAFLLEELGNVGEDILQSMQLPSG